MNIFGEVIKVSIFGESHNNTMGITISGFPAGFSIDFAHLDEELRLRRGKTQTTKRMEKDHYEIISGYFEDVTTGAPLTFLVKNSDYISDDYRRNIVRPSHADYTAKMKYDSFNDYRGGGHFSGRLTVLLTIIGALSKQVLSSKGIFVKTFIKQIGMTKYEDILNMDEAEILAINREYDYKRVKDDSHGGIVQSAIVGIKPGIGEPFFDSMESYLSHLIFSIPGVKGVSFGKGFEFVDMLGSEANDELYIDNSVRTYTNNSGGINGGISNGMPIVINTVFRPTPSIGKKQRSIDLEKGENVEISIAGRHDPCIALRGYHVVNSVISFGILDLIVRNEGRKWIL